MSTGSFRPVLTASAAFLLLVQGCPSCRNANTSGESSSSSSGSSGTGAGDGGNTGASSSGASGTSGNSSGGGSSGTSGSGGAGDAGNPLEEPLALFCMGHGAVIGVGGGSAATVCSGQLAQDTFQFALCACEQVVVGSNLSIDGFDSRVGPYGGANVLPDGQLGMNGGPLNLDNKLTVAGSVYIGGGGMRMGPSSTVSRNLTVNGDLTEGSNTHGTIGRNAFVHGNAPARYTVTGNLTVPPGATVAATVGGTVVQQDFSVVPPCPCGANQILDIGGITGWAATHNDNGATDAGVRPDLWASGTGPASITLPCGRYYVTNISSAGSLSIVAAGRVALFVDGDVSTGGFSISTNPGAEVDLFVKGNLTISGPSSFGSAASPVSVRTYVGGNLSVQASALFAGNVYAPHASVQFSASATVYGSIFAREVVFSGSADVHFDSAVRQAGQECTPPPPDGGTTVQDAGTSTNPDGGTVTTPDGGTVTTPDSGTVTTPDAGPSLCSGVCDSTCGALACLPTGVCGACVTDLDCCAPALCFSGACLAIGG